MNTKISHTMQASTSGKATINVPSRLSTFTTRLLATLALLITTAGGTAKAADEMVFFHVNALGSATVAFNENGDVCWKQHYTPYGEQTSNDDASPPTGCGLIGKDRGYTGHTQDESGLTYMQQRYFDPTIGRFLSEDPVGVIAENPNTYNRYMYANNNPYKFIDPDGMYAESPLEALSISIGVTSLAYNVGNGNILASLVDVGGLVLDGIGAAIPIVPGVASAGIAAYRGTDALTTVTGTAGSIRNVNPTGGVQNCVNCSIATDSTLAGRPSSALPGGPTSISVLEKTFGGKFGAAASRSGIEGSLLDAGNGARGIVFGSRGNQVGHVFNVVNQKGTIRFLDGQSGKAADVGGFDSLHLLRTN